MTIDRERPWVKVQQRWRQGVPTYQIKAYRAGRCKDVRYGCDATLNDCIRRSYNRACGRREDDNGSRPILSRQASCE